MMLIIMMIAVLVEYLLFSFGNTTYNIANWDGTSRIICACLMGFTMFFFMMEYIEEFKKRKS